MVTKLISSQTIISKVISDLDLSEDNIRISDMQEWIGEAINKIGGISEMNYKTDVLDLKCNQAKLPCDINKLIQVAYSNTLNGYWHKTRYNTGSFGFGKCNNNVDLSDCCTKCGKCGQCKCGSPRYIHDDILVKVYRTMYKKDNVSYDNALQAINSNDELRQTLRRLINSRDYRHYTGTDFSNDVQYYVKPGYIVCNIPDGYLKIAYNAVPRDEFGYAMVPDMESYIEAIYWYIVQKLQYPLYVSGKIPQHVYYDAKNSWNYYSKQAYGNIKMPNLDELESIKNVWNRIYPVLDEHDTFYSTAGQKQIIYNTN